MRRLVALLVLFVAGIGAARAVTGDQAMETCNNTTASCNPTLYTCSCIVETGVNGNPESCQVKGIWTHNNGATGSFGPWSFDCSQPPAPQCDAGGNPFTGTFSGEGSGGEHCGDDGCAYVETSGVEMCFGGSCAGSYAQTGETCEESNGDDDEGLPCLNLGGGYQQCKQGPDICIKTPSGKSFCWAPEESHQQEDDTDAADKSPGNSPPPTEPDRTPFIETHRANSTVNGQPTTITTYEGNEPDNDGDGKPNDEDDDDNICPPNNPDCEEEDDEEDEESVGDSPCASQGDPACVGDAVECGIFVKNHHIRCEIEHSNKLLKQLNDQQKKEMEETNAKLKAIRETTELNLRLVKAEVTKVDTSTKEVKTAAEATTAAVNNVKTAADGIKSNTNGLKASTDGVKASVDDVKAAVDGVKAAIQNTANEVTCTNCGLAIPEFPEFPDPNIQPEWTKANSMNSDAGQGVTQADLDATAIHNITLGAGDIDQAGFLGGGACPVFPAMTVSGVGWEIDSQVWCDFLAVLKAVFSLLGAYWSVLILLER